MTPQEAYEKRYTPEKFAEAPPEVRDVWLAAWTIAWAMAEQMEREACAKVCDELAALNRSSPTDSMWQWGECAAAIRARGQE